MTSKHEMPVELRDAISACRRHLLIAAGFSALVNVLYLAPTIYMMQVYDRVVPTGGINTLIWLTIIVALAIGCLTSLDALRNRLMMRASLKLNRKLSAPMLEKVIAHTRKNGDPAARQIMREFDTLRQAVSSPGVIALFDIPWTPIFFIVAWIIHPVLGIVILIAGAILAAIAIFNERATRKSSQQSHKALSGSYAREETLFSNAEVIRALGMRRALIARHITDRREGLESGVATQLTATHFTAITKFARMFLQSFALGVGAWLAVNGEISVGAIIAASVLLSRALQPIEQVVGAWPNLTNALQAKKAIVRLFQSEHAAEQRHVALPDPEGYVRMNKIVLRTPDDDGHILAGVSTWLIPGDILGVVGPSGAGKSTLARIAAGAIPCDSGQIRIDEAEYADWDPERLATFIGYMPQQPCLLPGTVAENISRFAVDGGAHQADVDQKVTEAAKAVGIHDMILHWPGGYNAVIGDGGLQLSGGQAQRIALARAIYGDPKVLILDEPNSALDSDGERALIQVIGTARQRNAALMIVSHRSSLLADADRLAVMKQGIIERQGPREEVLKSLREGAERAANVVDIRKETGG